MIGLPFLSFIYMLRLSPAVRNLMESPVNKFVSDAVSYATLILLIVLDAVATVRGVDSTLLMPSAIQWLIILTVWGMTSRYAKILYHKRKQFNVERITRALEDGSSVWHFFDLFMLLFFWLYIVLRIVGIAMHWSKMNELQRNDLNEFDPLLWSECAYVIAVIYAIARVNALLWISSQLGPMLISLTRIIWKVFLFLILFSIWLLAFVVGVTKLYAPYKVYLDKKAISITQYGR